MESPKYPDAKSSGLDEIYAQRRLDAARIGKIANMDIAPLLADEPLPISYINNVVWLPGSQPNGEAA